MRPAFCHESSDRARCVRSLSAEAAIVDGVQQQTQVSWSPAASAGSCGLPRRQQSCAARSKSHTVVSDSYRCISRAAWPADSISADICCRCVAKAFACSQMQPCLTQRVRPSAGVRWTSAMIFPAGECSARQRRGEGLGPLLCS